MVCKCSPNFRPNVQAFNHIFQLHHDPSENARSLGLKRAVGVRLGGSAVVDIVIAGSMTYYVRINFFHSSTN